MSEKQRECLPAPSLPGWYECRRLMHAGVDLRVALWWDGARLRFSPGLDVFYDLEYYTDFRGPLAPATKGPTP